MTRSVMQARPLLFGLLVAIALGFGVRSAVAAPATTDCPTIPPTALGTCINDSGCTTKCQFRNGPTYSGECVDGCCICEQP